MIATLHGTLTYKTTSYVIIDVQGIGYGVTVPLSTFYNLPEPGKIIHLIIHTHVTQDSLNLFGFLEKTEKDIFQLMISVSGIGPKLAVNILSGISVNELHNAIATANNNKLTSIPGVGKKMAERIIFELKEKILHTIPYESTTIPSSELIREDALSALINLGYNSKVANSALDKALDKLPSKITLENLINESLKILSN